ncbi:hypothetical protein J6590_057938 [Homalodisca vitripennis]|nr:hypothetical protein J6590_057938 [Homalodisca vitripennis]
MKTVWRAWEDESTTAMVRILNVTSRPAETANNNIGIGQWAMRTDRKRLKENRGHLSVCVRTSHVQTCSQRCLMSVIPPPRLIDGNTCPLRAAHTLAEPELQISESRTFTRLAACALPEDRLRSLPVVQEDISHWFVGVRQDLSVSPCSSNKSKEKFVHVETYKRMFGVFMNPHFYKDKYEYHHRASPSKKFGRTSLNRSNLKGLTNLTECHGNLSLGRLADFPYCLPEGCKYYLTDYLSVHRIKRARLEDCFVTLGVASDRYIFSHCIYSSSTITCQECDLFSTARVHAPATFSPIALFITGHMLNDVISARDNTPGEVCHCEGDLDTSTCPLTLINIYNRLRQQTVASSGVEMSL